MEYLTIFLARKKLRTLLKKQTDRLLEKMKEERKGVRRKGEEDKK